MDYKFQKLVDFERIFMHFLVAVTKQKFLHKTLEHIFVFPEHSE